MYRTWLTIVVATGLLVGCANTSENETEATTPEAVTEESVAAPAAPAEEAVLQEKAAASINQVNTAASAGLNPPHGEPGHDCAIAVGAPLDGSAAQPQAAPAPTAAQPAAQPNFSGAAATAAGLNPPHGQPGHDCAVAVGAPLPAK